MLNVSNNMLGPMGALCLAAGVSGGSLLSELDISYNKIGTRGAKAIGDMLRNNRTLRVLNLWQNGLTKVRPRPRPRPRTRPRPT